MQELTISYHVVRPLRLYALALSGLVFVLGIFILSTGAYHGYDSWDFWSRGMQVLSCLQFAATALSLICNIADFIRHPEDLGKTRLLLPR